MQFHQSNRLLPVLGIAMLAITVLIVQRACSEDEPDPVLLDAVPQASSPDADTPHDTITTLTANVAAMTRELEGLENDNAALKRDNRDLKEQREALEQSLSTRIAAELKRIQDNAAVRDSETVNALHQRIDAIADAVDDARRSTNASELPIGFGFDQHRINEDIVWVEPLDTDGGGATSRTDADDLPSTVLDTQVRPRFTVPRNATLLGSTAMTAMLGRVPIRGEVQDPMPFKVLTGVENLAANGYSLPGVAGMVWTGTAIGDWTLSCVSGELHSVTFVFADGSIQTLSSDEPNNQDSGRRRALGWISDDRGVPCVTGSRQSNAASFLSQRIAAKAVQAAADAAAAAQTNSVIRDSGAVTTTVDGDLGAFLLGRAVADSGSEIAEWLSERQAQSFDAVFVPAGANLVIHVDRQLAIDLDPNARKLHYASDNRSIAADALD